MQTRIAHSWAKDKCILESVDFMISFDVFFVAFYSLLSLWGI